MIHHVFYYASACALLVVLPPFALAQGKKAKAGPEHYQIKPGEFPAANSATHIGGELIALDRVNRTGSFRLDRTDAQSRAHWDLPIAFTMLPYGSVWYHGAPAELRDIPLGTHLHGLFYWNERTARDPQTKLLIDERRIHPDSGFHWVLKFEDDFSYFHRQKRAWRIDGIDLETKTLTATGIGLDGMSPDAKASIFQISGATRIWKGNGFGSLQDLQVGATVLMNFTFRTMKLSGRCTDIWLDERSQAHAIAQQLEVHRLYQREHGLAGWIDRVDDKSRTLTATLFEGFDPQLKKDFEGMVLVKEKLLPPFVALAVAEDSLRGYDPLNDNKRAPILETTSAPTAPGSSGWQITCQPELMLEGFRTKRIIRVYAGRWGVADLPREERLFP